MKFATRLALSSACIFGAIALSNEINDVDTSFINAATITIVYQAALAAIGGAIFLIGTYFGLIPKEQLVEPVIEEDDGFEIKEIITDGFKVVGKFGGKQIHEHVKVIFENGFEALYKFEDTIKYENSDNIDVSNLTPGSLILEPGIVYVPIK